MDWLSFVNTVAYVIAVFISLSECGRLNEYILDYQPLTYDRSTVHKNHQRVRRSADSQLHLRFRAYDRDFHLQLEPLRGVFSENHELYTDGSGPRRVDTSFIYQGHVKGEPQSWVHLAVHNGSLEGQVEVPETTYHIEPAAKYLSDHRDPALHTIIYPETHLDKDPYRDRRQKEAASCGVDHFNVREFMEKASRLHEGPKPNVHARAARADDHQRQSHNIYTEYSNRAKRSTGESSSRQKRSLGSRNACPLHMRADPLLFSFFKHTKHGRTIEDNKQVEEEILAFFSSHVSAISRIYSSTLFETYSGGMQNTGLSFVIHRSTVMTGCEGGTNRAYCENTVDVSNYLDLTSEEDHDLYCLVFTFTYRDFSGGTLGLAWVATLANTQSGVCGRYSTYSGGKKKSLNTGIVTIINFGRTIPNRVSQLTFAHEVGHNFGSPHDEGSAQCAPFGTGLPDANSGNFIMFPSATSGDKPNNDLFSPCSRDNITRIIQQVLEDQARKDCFVVSGEAFCGNKITEGTEQCDCGFSPCDPKTCCEGRVAGDTNSGCKLIAGIECSPDSGPCCTDTCYFKPADSVTCAEATECKKESKCNGNSFKCPEPDHELNGTFCNDFSKVCSSGECIGPVCQRISTANGVWEECFLTSESGDSSSLCYVACQNPITKICVSSKDTAALAKDENSAFKDMLAEAGTRRRAANPRASDKPEIELPAGSPCDNFRGYCDTFSKCQRIDAEGPFIQLTNMIFNPVNFTIIREWIEVHWWAVLLMALGVMVFMGVFIKVFGYNTPSQDPKKERIRKHHQRHMRRQQGVSC